MKIFFICTESLTNANGIPPSEVPAEGVGNGLFVEKNRIFPRKTSRDFKENTETFLNKRRNVPGKTLRRLIPERKTP